MRPLRQGSVPAGYKQTDVGVIPEDWEVRTIAELCTKIQDGTHFSPSVGGNDFLYVTSKNIGFGFLDVSNTDRIDTAQHKAIYKRCDVRKGDLLLTKDGASTGNAALNILDEEFSLLSSVALLRFDPKRHTAGFFLQQILSHPGQKRIKDAMTGNAITRLTLQKIRRLPFPVAPLPEQEAIVEVLSNADALIESLEQLLAKKRQLKQGAMQELLTGKKRLPGFESKPGYKQTEVGVIPEDWAAKTIDAVAFVTSGKRLPPGHSLAEHETLHPYIRVSDMRPGTVDRSDIRFVPVEAFPAIGRYRIYKEDIFISVAGTLGIVGKVPPELDGANLTENADRITKITCSQDYLLHVLMSPLIQGTIDSLQTVGAQPKLALTRIRKFVIPLPPTKAEQEGIAVVLSDMDAEIATLEANLAKARQLKQGMMQALLTGRIQLLQPSQGGEDPAC